MNPAELREPEMEKLNELLTAYGNASFDCGDFGQPIDVAGNKAYGELARKAESAKEALRAYVRGILEGKAK